MSRLWLTYTRKVESSAVFCLGRICNDSQNRNWPKLFFLSHAPQKREAWVSLEDKSSSTKCPKKDNCRVDTLPYFLPSNTMAEDRPADQEISLHGDGHGHQVAPGDKYLTIMIMMWSDDDHVVIRWSALDDRGKIKAVCGDLGHCSLLFKSDPNAALLLGAIALIGMKYEL